MLKIKTTKLQELVSKAFKGASNNKLKPITELICIKVENNLLTLITTDYDNYLYITESVESDDFYAVVKVNQFAKLIARLTSEDTILDVANNSLEIKANGNYRIPVEVDVNTGKLLKYTDPLSNENIETAKKIGYLTAEDIQTILRALKPALATTVAMPEYANYYLGEGALATDSNTASCYGKLMTSTPILVSPQVMDMLDVYTGENAIEIREFDGNDRLLFIGDNLTLFGYKMQGADTFAVDKLNDYINTEYPHKCKISKQELLQALDRLSLFVGEFDDDTVGIAFTQDGLQLSSRQSNSVETLPYIESAQIEELHSYVYLEMMRSQVKAQTGDAIDLYYGEPNSIKFVDDASKVTSVVCLVSVG